MPCHAAAAIFIIVRPFTAGSQIQSVPSVWTRGQKPDYGIKFGSDSLAVIKVTAGGSGSFDFNPSGSRRASFVSGLGVIMDVPAGFTTGFSFFYCAIVYPGSVTVYDGLDGMGNVLASLSLPVTPNLGHDYPQAYDNWQPIRVAFSGTARSVNFCGVANCIGFDDITLRTDTPGVPEPSTLIIWSLLRGLGISLGRHKSLPPRRLRPFQDPKRDPKGART